MQAQSTMQQQLQIQNEIKQKEGKLITNARDLIDSPYVYKSEENNKGRFTEWYEKYEPTSHPDNPYKYFIYGSNKKRNEILEEKQVRNVLDVALQTDCVEVIDTFIKYQIGRSGGSEKWKFGDFGESLIGVIQKNGVVYKMAEQIAQNLKVNPHLDSIWLQLTRLYLGHLNRYFYYKKNEHK